MPASPLSSTTCPCPSATCSQRRRNSPTSSSRPTRGVKPVVTVASKRLCAALAPSTRYTAMGWRTPLRACVPIVSQVNKPCTSCCVAALMTTVSGAARPWRRAAMLGVSPRASCSCRSPPPISPTTTRPVWMPRRTASRTRRSRSRRLLSCCIASRMASAVWTARGASSSCASG